MIDRDTEDKFIEVDKAAIEVVDDWEVSQLVFLFLDFWIEGVDGLGKFVGLVKVFVVNVDKEAIKDGDGQRHGAHRKAPQIQ